MCEPAVAWSRYLALDREIRALLVERMEHGATNELDRKPMAVIEQPKRVERAAGSLTSLVIVTRNLRRNPN